MTAVHVVPDQPANRARALPVVAELSVTERSVTGQLPLTPHHPARPSLSTGLRREGQVSAPSRVKIRNTAVCLFGQEPCWWCWGGRSWPCWSASVWAR